MNDVYIGWIEIEIQYSNLHIEWIKKNFFSDNLKFKFFTAVIYTTLPYRKSQNLEYFVAVVFCSSDLCVRACLRVCVSYPWNPYYGNFHFFFFRFVSFRFIVCYLFMIGCFHSCCLVLLLHYDEQK